MLAGQCSRLRGVSKLQDALSGGVRCSLLKEFTQGSNFDTAWRF
jgi:hypothetical protein